MILQASVYFSESKITIELTAFATRRDGKMNTDELRTRARIDAANEIARLRNQLDPVANVLCSDGLCRFADIEDCTWFLLPDDPEKKKYFKCNNRSAIGRDYKSFFVNSKELVEPTAA